MKKKLGKSDAAKKFAKQKGATKIKITKIAIGHQPHQSGAGTHRDERLKRQSTRRQTSEKAIDDSIS